jgi:hypothetical protein
MLFSVEHEVLRLRKKKKIHAVLHNSIPVLHCREEQHQSTASRNQWWKIAMVGARLVTLRLN